LDARVLKVASMPPGAKASLKAVMSFGGIPRDFGTMVCVHPSAQLANIASASKRWKASEKFWNVSFILARTVADMAAAKFVDSIDQSLSSYRRNTYSIQSGT